MSACIAASAPSAARPAPGICNVFFSIWQRQAPHAPNRRHRSTAFSASTISSSNSPTSTAPARPAPTSFSRNRSCAWACPWRRATSSPPTSRACRPGMRCASRRTGYLGAREGTDLMVAMNPQTWDQDIASILPGGYLFYDSTKPIPESRFRERHQHHRHAADRTVQPRIYRSAPAPAFQEHHLCRRPGGLAGYRNRSPRNADRRAVQVQGKTDRRQHPGAAYGPRLRAGPSALPDRPDHPPLRRRRRPHFHRGQCRRRSWAPSMAAPPSRAWYPITPSSSLAEAFQRYCTRYRMDKETGEKRFAIVQAEDELSSIGMVIGAAWNGARAFTSTSGPGISLMQEFFGLAYFAEIPAVIFDVQRAGPSTGMPTRTQQCDLSGLRLCLAWRHQTRPALPRRPA